MMLLSFLFGRSDYTILVILFDVSRDTFDLLYSTIYVYFYDV